MTKAINTKTINTIVLAALRCASEYGARINALKTELHGVAEADASNVITPIIAGYYGIDEVKGKRGLTFEGGPKGADKTGTKAYMAAKAARTRLLRDVYGNASSASAVPAVQRFNRAKVEAIQQCIAGMSKAEAKAYFAKALEAAFA
jgi:hypothetical protein